MTMTALPTDPTKLPTDPVSVELSALHLSITQNWESDSTHNIHMLENGDLIVILKRGKPGSERIPFDDVAGHVVVALGVNENHDEVHFTGENSLDAEEIMGQAIEALAACRNALKRVRTS